MAILEGSIQHCRNTEANWISSDPITIDGQLYFSIDVFYGSSDFPKVKFGDGTSLWSDRDYLPLSVASSIPQATESLLGGGEIATQAEVEDDASTDDTKIVSVKKLWLALAKFKTLIKALFSDVNTGTEDNKFITPLALSGSGYQRSSTLTAGYIPYSVDGKTQANSPLKRISSTQLELNGKFQSPSAEVYVSVDNTQAVLAFGNVSGSYGSFVSSTEATLTASDFTNTSKVKTKSNEIEIDSNTITHVKGTTNSILSLNASKKVTYNAGVGYLKMDGAGAITFDAGITSETNTIYTAAWSTQTLANVRKLFYYVNASDSTAKTINLNATPTSWDEVYIKDKKGDATTNVITIQGNGKNIDGVASIPLNRNNQGYLLKYDGTQWNIL